MPFQNSNDKGFFQGALQKERGKAKSQHRNKNRFARIVTLRSALIEGVDSISGST